MNTNTHQLRLNAYAVTAAGHIQCFNGERPDEKTAVLRIDLAEDTKAGHDLVARLLDLVDEPRALRGTCKGSVVMLFRCGERNPAPYIQGNDRRDGVFEMATRAGERFTITCASDGQTLDVDAHTWPKGRSPLEIERDRLPVLTDKIGAAVVREAFEFATWALVVEQERVSAARLDQIRADIASGKVKILTEAELDAAEDERIVAAHEGQDISYGDGPLAINIIAARKRHAHRKRQSTAAA